jgi:hypothetical protein
MHWDGDTQSNSSSGASASPASEADHRTTRLATKTKPSYETTARDIGSSPLALEGWLEFNRVKWNVQPRRLRFHAPNTDRPALEAVLYLDKHGRVRHPPRNPYLPVRFQSTPTLKRHRLLGQWAEMSGLLVAETRRLGLKNTLTLPPEVIDVRAWQWAGFRAGIRYTLFIDFPFHMELAEKDIGKIARKAERIGYRCARTTSMADVAVCLAETETRQGFQLGLSVADLDLAAQLLGEEHLRAYVCYGPTGEPASASVVLHLRGAPAIGWLGGTRTADLRGGATQLLELFVIDDLEANEASVYDLSGANFPNIANSKATWGARLQPYYSIESYSVRRLAKWTLNWWEYLKKGRAR